jgi:glycosyltransferase involved in cell wall biosynthesis
LSPREKPLKVAYLLSIFPALSETFILNEIIELRRQGLDISIFSLLQPNKSVIHKEAEELAKEVHYFAANIYLNKFKKVYIYLYVHLYFLISNPFKYLKTFWFAYTVGKYRYVFSEFRVAAYYAFTLKNSKVNHIHAHFASTASEYAMLASMVSGIPYSFTMHAIDIFVKPKLIREKVDFAEFVVSISEYNKRFIKEKYPGIDANKIHVIHCGINLEWFIPSEYDRSRKKPFTILSVARLVEKKGHRYLLEACNILTKRGISKFICKIIGDGPLKNDLEELTIEYGLNNVVQFAGALPSDKVVYILKEADLFVLPCVVAKDGDMDGIPYALIEAMALGKPVISTCVSGIPELIKDGVGILVPPGNSEALARAIEEIYLKSPEMKIEMGQRGREIIEREFNLKEEVKKIKDLFLFQVL